MAHDSDARFLRPRQWPHFDRAPACLHVDASNEMHTQFLNRLRRCGFPASAERSLPPGSGAPAKNRSSSVEIAAIAAGKFM